MTPDQLTALAARLRDHASDYITHPDDACKHSDLLDAAEYLRQCAQSDAVEALRRIIEAANGRQRHNPITDEMHAALRYARAVLAAQGGKDAE